MAGRGPAKAQTHTRARNDVKRETVKSDGKLGGFPLPEGLLGVDKDGNEVEWHPATVRWWENWRRSPQGTRMVTDPDWDFLLDTALIHHNMWKNGRWEFASEVRLRAAKFGVSPEDRARLKFEIEVPEQYPAGNAGNVTSIDSRRTAILAADAPGF